ncbi:MAG: methyltransferase domain-containing protein [Planctomycetaceae bacterium]|nr:methyltransferase domain-containing protein [Planctomycetaceae bacterium]
MIPITDTDRTFWEEMAQSRWGQYLSGIESTTLRLALEHFERPGEALEVGCEGGRWSRSLASCGWKMTCLDINADTLAVCRRRIPSALCLLYAADSQQFPINSRSIDLLISIEVPINETAWFASEAARVLRPDGLMVCTFNNLDSYRGRLANLRASLSGDEPQYITGYSACRRRLTEAGLTIMHETGFAWLPFGRGSNSRWVPSLVQLERQFGLRRIVRYSPWVATVAKPTCHKNRESCLD